MPINDSNERRYNKIARRRQVEEKSKVPIARALRRQLRTAVAPSMTIDELRLAPQRIEEDNTMRDAILLALLAAALIGRDSAGEQLAELGLGLDDAAAQAMINEWVDGRATESGQMVNRNSREYLRREIERWIANGLPYAALAAQLDTYFGDRRAELISITETTAGYNGALDKALIVSGLSFRMWWTMLDERVCPICRPLHGQIRPIGVSFDGGIDSPPVHPLCRCSIVGVLEGM